MNSRSPNVAGTGWTDGRPRGLDRNIEPEEAVMLAIYVVAFAAGFVAGPPRRRATSAVRARR